MEDWNGERVQIYKGNWIPGPTSFKGVSLPSLSINAIVSELIDVDNQQNEGLINQHFVREDAGMILRIPLPNKPMADQILQHYDKKGDYAVKSGCQVALKINFSVFQDAQTRKQINGQSFGLCIYQKKIIHLESSKKSSPNS